jgi:PAS domain S-box-containing protein
MTSTVLIIDDTFEDRKVLRGYLEDEYLVLEAELGEQGLTLYREKKPDCVLIAYRLPDINGLEVLRSVAGGERSGACAFVMLTSSSEDAAVAVRALKSGAHDYLNKNTLDAQEIKHAVRGALHNVALRRELQKQRAALLQTNRELEQTLSSLRLLDAAVAQSGDAILITDSELDPPGPKIVFVNPAFTQMTGYSADEALGRSPRLLQGPKTDRAVLDRVRAQCSRGEVFQGKVVNYRKDGREFILEWRVTPLRNAQGKIAHFVAVQHDVTEREQAQKAIEASNQRFGAAFHANPLAVAIVSFPDGELLDVNPAFRLQSGFEWHEMAGKTTAELGIYVYPEQRAEFFRLLAEHGRVQDFEAALRTKGGDIRTCLLSAEIIELEGRRCLLTGSNDITERKRLEDDLRRYTEQLQQADRRKDEFLAMLAHELRNPLAPIRNAVQVFDMLAPQQPELTKVRDMIARQVEHLSRLVDDLLDVSRITQGKITLRKSAVELGQIVSNVVDLARPMLDARLQALSLNMPAEPIRLNADSTRLEQAIANILNNAVKYTQQGGKIAVSLERRTRPHATMGEAVITVRDNGPGISSALLPHVFDLFAQAERTLDRSEGGLGIGLSLVKRLIELHGGSVEARSKGPGEGSEFVVRLPIEPAPHDAQETIPGAKRREPGASRRVLVVDDNEDTAQSLALVLRLQGHEVQIAHHGLTALQLASEAKPEIVILDIGLPGIDGFEVARKLRADAQTRNATLIALTGYGQAEDRRRSQEAGFDHHLVKPVDPTVLGALIAAIA